METCDDDTPSVEARAEDEGKGGQWFSCVGRNAKKD